MSNGYQSLDPEGMHQQIYTFPGQIESAYQIANESVSDLVRSTASAVLIAGMGGSAIGGDLIKSLTADSAAVPIEVVRDYSLPEWVGPSTLVICVSYSGNTEETLSCYNEAIEKGAQLVGITSGGELAERLRTDGGDLITIPGGNPPRASLGLVSIPALIYLSQQGLCSASNTHEIAGTVALLTEARSEFSKESDSNRTLKMAKKIYDSIPIIYGDARYTGSVALRFRGQLEENAKMVAFHHSLPELNHNEIVGYLNNPELLKNLGIVWLMDESQHPRTVLRQSLTKDLIGDIVGYQEEIHSMGSSLMERLFYLIHYCDWVSYWCAVLHGTDPTPVKRIQALKESLSTGEEK